MKKTNLFSQLLLCGIILSASIVNAQTWLGTGAAGNTGSIYRSGNVGIGTFSADPTSNLHLKGRNIVLKIEGESVPDSLGRPTNNFSGLNILGNFPTISLTGVPNPGGASYPSINFQNVYELKYSMFPACGTNGFKIGNITGNAIYINSDGTMNFGTGTNLNCYNSGRVNANYSFNNSVGVTQLLVSPVNNNFVVANGFLVGVNGKSHFNDYVTIGSSTDISANGYKLNVSGNTAISGNRIVLGGTNIRGSYTANDFAMELQGPAFSGLSIISDVNGSNHNSVNIFSSAVGNSAGIAIGKAGTNVSLPFSILNGSAKLQVNPNGNVGIGTMAVPNAPLHVQSTGDISYVNIATTSTANKRTRLNFSQTNASGVNTLGMEIGSDYSSNNTNDLYIFSRTSNKLLSHFHGTSGNVGIGAAADASARLFVSGDAKVSGNVGIQSSSVLEFGVGLTKEVNAGKIGYGTFDANSLNIVGAGTTGLNRRITFYNEGGATFNGGVNVTGNVGIGTTAVPTSKLQVLGNAEFNMYDGQMFSINNNSSQPWGSAKNYSIWFGKSDKAAMTLIKPGNSWWHMSSEASGSLVFSSGGNPGDSPLLSLTSTNQVTIGTTAAPVGYKLAVDGAIICQNKVQVCNTGGWCDYVFEPNYELMPLEQLDGFIQANKHLPEIPSAAVVEKDGVDLMTMNKLLLKKVEELTLYTIAQEKRLKALEIKK